MGPGPATFEIHRRRRVHFGLTRLFGPARPGQRVVEATRGDSGLHSTLLATLGLEALQAVRILKGAMEGAAFKVYIEEALLPALRPDEIVMFHPFKIL